ncbi:hypothetical protein [Methanothermococcus sp.]|uniref:hypothetical protein n=1 Tax=Methanothermococcus sp. TaxID=2614238 RepID=UPI0025CCAD24|nr:hypothetical protein [Methanothermococcus sp.]
MPSTSKYYLKKYYPNQNLIENIIKRLKSGSRNYLFDTIFVLYFIILYEFYPAVLKEMKLGYESKINTIKNPDWVLSFKDNSTTNQTQQNGNKSNIGYILKKFCLKAWVLNEITEIVNTQTKKSDETSHKNLPFSGLIELHHKWKNDNTIEFKKRGHYAIELYNNAMTKIEKEVRNNIGLSDISNNELGEFNKIIEHDRTKRILNPISVLSYFFMPNTNDDKPTAKYSAEHNEYLTATIIRSEEYTEINKIYANFWICLEKILEGEYATNNNKLGSDYNILNLFDMVETLL